MVEERKACCHVAHVLLAIRWIGPNLAHIQRKIMIQKMHFC